MFGRVLTAPLVMKGVGNESYKASNFVISSDKQLD